MRKGIKSCKLKNHGDHKSLKKKDLLLLHGGTKTVYLSKFFFDSIGQIGVLRKQKDCGMKDVSCSAIGQQ